MKHLSPPSGDSASRCIKRQQRCFYSVASDSRLLLLTPNPFPFCDYPRYHRSRFCLFTVCAGCRGGLSSAASTGDCGGSSAPERGAFAP